MAATRGVKRISQGGSIAYVYYMDSPEDLASITPSTRIAFCLVGPSGREVPYVYVSGAWHTTVGDAIGADGPQGIPGPMGPNGTQGPQGETGAQGSAGPTGAMGATGPAGLVGPMGPRGSKGDDGPKGDAGPQGTNGTQGPAGPAGAQGTSGGTGSTGPIGPIGLTGSQGPQGSAGATGATGSTGATGATGSAGAQGAQGAQGVKGDTGNTGPAGADGADGADGDTGPQGAQGIQGIQGTQGVKGDKGDTGDTGAQGSQGIQGTAGPNSVSGSTTTALTGVLKGNGSVVSGAATTADLPDSADKRYVTDAQRTVIGNTSGTNTGDQDLSGKQPLDSDLTTIAGLTATTDNFMVAVASAWASRTPAQVKTTLALNNVDNTSDANKPVSTAEQTALNLKANLASPTFTGTVVLPAATVTLAMQANMATASLVYRKSASSGPPEVNTLATLKTDLALVKGDVGLGNVDNTADTAKPVSTATQTALDLKSPLASPTFTGTVTVPGITLSDATDITINATTGSKVGQSGSKIGFFGVTPVVRPTALTQTYNTTSATHAAVTQLAAPAGGTGAAAGAWSTAANRDLAITSINAARTDIANLKNFVNQIVDQLQALGLLQ